MTTKVDLDVEMVLFATYVRFLRIMPCGKFQITREETEL